MKILGIETSCDDTAVGIVEDGRNIISNIVFSQADMHSEFGGIIPEVASREHIVKIIPGINKALNEARMNLNDIDAVSVTYGPGLAGSLLIGVNTAKSMAIASGLPFIGINHIEGHIYATCLAKRKARFPYYFFSCFRRTYRFDFNERSWRFSDYC